MGALPYMLLGQYLSNLDAVVTPYTGCTLPSRHIHVSYIPGCRNYQMGKIKSFRYTRPCKYTVTICNLDTYALTTNSDQGRTQYIYDAWLFSSERVLQVQHGISFSSFLANGISMTTVLNTPISGTIRFNR